ncbi:hypothetical protein J5N97_015107 [Dioscorea zingiberensis]|uniref:Bifunctional inhibitor/plant lipid transfer protein/seed storage helical domain-containing protein n=1 Tax=Dioscorea zingiberensis TaxID=325984 RepID=A0A9D5CUQ7_9LILI|nr:hypothetical protein J5N97_015107 [Dioscorea zingiberensis]
MATPTTLNLLFMISSFLLVLLPKLTTSQFGSMCVSQFALANQACSVIPPEEEEPIGDSGQVMLQRHRHHAHKHANHSSEHEGDPDHDQEHDNEHEHDDEHENDDDHDDGEHERRHRQHPRANRDCCRWLQEVERSCVCETLRRLPAFLTRPIHSYTISVGTTCEITFRCDGL